VVNMRDDRDISNLSRVLLVVHDMKKAPLGDALC
jgi:hypothetical protein